MVDTSHVPCKFFRQGACQAGNSCPFSHDLTNTNDNVCKYFAKGNCKFGPKCANAHILPNGHRVNYNKGSLMGGHLNIGGRVNPDPYRGQSSALTNGFNGVPPSPFGPGQFSLFGNDEPFPVPGVAMIDTSFTTPPTSAYGSPGHDDRFGYGGLSPNANATASRGLSVLDAPLPASFDSNGLSAYAHHAVGKGALASSVPAKFGLDSPLGSVGVSSEALKNLQASAFADDTRDRFNGNGSSPPTYPSEEYFGKRAMHSQRNVKPKVMSSSLPKAVDQDWNAEFTFEEDYLPEALKDLMTPQEKARRGSRNADEEGRPILHSGAGTPINTGTPINEVGSKWGSPSNASPSRWGPLFQRHQQEKEEEKSSRASAFGHVGSPLRNSSLHPGASPSSRPIARPSLSGDSSPYMASPPRQSTMSGISQQLQRTRLSRAESTGSDSGLHPSRATSNPIGSGPRTVAERQISSSSIGGSGRFTTPIDEEQSDFVFKMDGMDDEEKKSEKRNSGGWVHPGKPTTSTTTGNGLDGMFGSR